MSKTPLIQFTNVSYCYEDSTQPALSNISLSVEPGEWLAVTGPAGSGKSTLCKLLCGMLQAWPEGQLQGLLEIAGCDVSGELPPELAGHIGPVFQDPETGLILDVIEDELAFGPENLQTEPEEIERRIDQALRDVELTGMRTRRIGELSGGQKQRIAIASVLTLKPRILVLDEASANLDQPAASKLQETLLRLRRQGHAIITASSRLDENTLADRVLLLEQGRAAAQGPAKAMLSGDTREKLIGLGCLPRPAAESRPVMRSSANAASVTVPAPSVPLLAIQSLSFGYPSNPDILRELQLSLYQGDLLALLGPNGSGKTTLGKLIAGLLPLPVGHIQLRGVDISELAEHELAERIGYLFQNPEHQFVASTVLEECIYSLHQLHIRRLGRKEAAAALPQTRATGEDWLRQFGLNAEKDRNPHSLSVAQQRLLNLASVLITEPELLILDEPTSGMGYTQADEFMEHCAAFTRKGGAVILITHDHVIVQKYATKQLLLGDGASFPPSSQ